MLRVSSGGVFGVDDEAPAGISSDSSSSIPAMRGPDASSSRAPLRCAASSSSSPMPRQSPPKSLMLRHSNILTNTSITSEPMQLQRDGDADDATELSRIASKESRRALIIPLTTTTTLQGLCVRYGVNAEDIRRENRVDNETQLAALKQIRIPIELMPLSIAASVDLFSVTDHNDSSTCSYISTVNNNNALSSSAPSAQELLKLSEQFAGTRDGDSSSTSAATMVTDLNHGPGGRRKEWRQLGSWDSLTDPGNPSEQRQSTDLLESDVIAWLRSVLCCFPLRSPPRADGDDEEEEVAANLLNESAVSSPISDHRPMLRHQAFAVPSSITSRLSSIASELWRSSAVPALATSTSAATTEYQGL